MGLTIVEKFAEFTFRRVLDDREKHEGILNALSSKYPEIEYMDTTDTVILFFSLFPDSEYGVSRMETVLTENVFFEQKVSSELGYFSLYTLLQFLISFLENMSCNGVTVCR